MYVKLVERGKHEAADATPFPVESNLIGVDLVDVSTVQRIMLKGLTTEGPAE